MQAVLCPPLSEMFLGKESPCPLPSCFLGGSYGNFILASHPLLPSVFAVDPSITGALMSPLLALAPAVPAP